MSLGSKTPKMAQLSSSLHDQIFVQACWLARVPTTRRQLSKYLAGRGAAACHRTEAQHHILEREHE